MTKKQCSKCKNEKSFDEFSKCKTGTHGLQGYCKLCQSESSRIYEKNRKQRTEYNKIQWQRRKDDPHYLETRSRWKEKNKQKIKEKQREYYLSHKDESNARRTNERARSRNISGVINVSDWIMMLNVSEFKCLACEDECQENTHLSPDHVISFYDGGTNYIGNIQPLCLYCQLRKGRRSVDFRTEEFNKRIKQKCVGQYMA